MIRGIAASDDDLSAKIRKLYRIAQFRNNFRLIGFRRGAPAAELTMPSPVIRLLSNSEQYGTVRLPSARYKY